MALFQRGHKKIGGRKKGTQNKATVGVRDSILAVAEELGGRERLLAWVNADFDNERVFWSQMWLKVLPHDTNIAGPTKVTVMFPAGDD